VASPRSHPKRVTPAVRPHAGSLINSLRKSSCVHRPVPPTLVAISFCLQRVELRVQVSILGDFWQWCLACKGVIMAGSELAVSICSLCFDLAPKHFSGLQSGPVNACGLTQRAAEVWESARFQAVCVAWSWFRQIGVVSSHHLQVTQTVSPPIVNQCFIMSKKSSDWIIYAKQ